MFSKIIEIKQECHSLESLVIQSGLIQYQIKLHPVVLTHRYQPSCMCVFPINSHSLRNVRNVNQFPDPSFYTDMHPSYIKVLWQYLWQFFYNPADKPTNGSWEINITYLAEVIKRQMRKRSEQCSHIWSNWERSFMVSAKSCFLSYFVGHFRTRAPKSCLIGS